MAVNLREGNLYLNLAALGLFYCLFALVAALAYWEQSGDLTAAHKVQVLAVVFGFQILLLLLIWFRLRRRKRSDQHRVKPRPCEVVGTAHGCSNSLASNFSTTVK